MRALTGLLPFLLGNQHRDLKHDKGNTIRIGTLRLMERVPSSRQIAIVGQYRSQTLPANRRHLRRAAHGCRNRQFLAFLAFSERFVSIQQ